MLGGASWNELELVVILLGLVMLSSYVPQLGEALGAVLEKRAPPAPSDDGAPTGPQSRRDGPPRARR